MVRPEPAIPINKLQEVTMVGHEQCILGCIICQVANNLVIYPHMKNNRVVGIVYVCNQHEKEVQLTTVNLTPNSKE